MHHIQSMQYKSFTHEYTCASLPIGHQVVPNRTGAHGAINIVCASVRASCVFNGTAARGILGEEMENEARGSVQ